MSTRAYYEIRVAQIDIDVSFCEVPKTDPNGKHWPPSRYEVDDPETGKRWSCDGLVLGPTLDADDLRAARARRGPRRAGGSVRARRSGEPPALCRAD